MGSCASCAANQRVQSCNNVNVQQNEGKKEDGEYDKDSPRPEETGLKGAVGRTLEKAAQRMEVLDKVGIGLEGARDVIDKGISLCEAVGPYAIPLQIVLEIADKMSVFSTY